MKTIGVPIVQYCQWDEAIIVEISGYLQPQTGQHVNKFYIGMAKISTVAYIDK